MPADPGELRMVTLYVGGKAVGTLADAARLFPRFIAGRAPVEFRDEAGGLVGRFLPEPPADADAGDPDSVRAITPEETARRAAEPGFTLEEWRARGGRP